jgi:MarR family transcriptional regulator, transcriptional regulator for hemolysin
MNDVELDRAFGFVVHDVARLLAKRFDQRAKSLGLTRAQWRALAFLAREEGINQARLADILEVEPITLVRLVDRMEEAGWLMRRPHPTDRRLRLLFLTEKARAIFARMRVIGAAVREDALAGLTSEEHDRLIDLLLRVRTNLSEPSSEPSRSEPSGLDSPAAALARSAEG